MLTGSAQLSFMHIQYTPGLTMQLNSKHHFNSSCDNMHINRQIPAEYQIPVEYHIAV